MSSLWTSEKIVCTIWFPGVSLSPTSCFFCWFIQNKSAYVSESVILNHQSAPFNISECVFSSHTDCCGTGCKSLINCWYIFHIFIFWWAGSNCTATCLDFLSVRACCHVVCVCNSFISDAWLVAPSCSLQAGSSSQQGISASQEKNGFQLNYSLMLNQDLLTATHHWRKALPSCCACFPADVQSYSLQEF